jgi:hypothetical protein
VIKKKWFSKIGDEDREFELQPLQQRIFPAKAVERVLLAKRLRVIVAASVALGASLLIHPSLAIIIVPVSTFLYAREIISIWRKRYSANRNHEC